MPPAAALGAFLVARVAQLLAETRIARINAAWVRDPARRAELADTPLGHTDWDAALAYFADRHRLTLVWEWTLVPLGLAFLAAGGLGRVEVWSRTLAGAAGLRGQLAQGLVFLGLLALGLALASVPFQAWSTFVVEQRHGFNRQTPAGFARDLVVAGLLASVLGGAVCAAWLELIVVTGGRWWLPVWGVLFGFAALSAWIFPTLIAPLFHRFAPLSQGPLRDRLAALVERAGFRVTGLYVVDASRRTAHGNAWFAGLPGSRRIALFDTLVEALSPAQAEAVVAHELGHYRLGHVGRSLARSGAASGLALGVAAVLTGPGGLAGFSLPPVPHAVLAVSVLWMSLVGFAASPLAAAASRRHEAEADAFAVSLGCAPDALAGALVRLAERSHALPVAHPWHVGLYAGHPPLDERVRRIEALAPGARAL